MDGSQVTRGPRRLRVLQSVRTVRSTTNPYIQTLLARLTEHATVLLFSWRGAFFSRYDVFHVQWPEILIVRSSPWRSFVQAGLLVMLLTRLWVTRTPIVRTVHNLAPHERVSPIVAIALNLLDRRTRLRIVLNASESVPGASIVIPHPDYREWFEHHRRAAPTPRRIGFVGQIRAYKNVDGLVAAFSEIQDASATLVVAGAPSDPSLLERIEWTVGGDGRIAVIPGHLPDDELVEVVTRCSLIALPYRTLYNSGAVMLALTLARPVLVPETPTMTALAAEVGEQWVIRFSGPLTSRHVTEALDAAGSMDDSTPDLRLRSWDASIDAHLRAYRLVVPSRALDSRSS